MPKAFAPARPSRATLTGALLSGALLLGLALATGLGSLFPDAQVGVEFSALAVLLGACTLLSLSRRLAST